MSREAHGMSRRLMRSWRQRKEKRRTTTHAPTKLRTKRGLRSRRLGQKIGGHGIPSTCVQVPRMDHSHCTRGQSFDFQRGRVSYGPRRCGGKTGCGGKGPSTWSGGDSRSRQKPRWTNCKRRGLKTRRRRRQGRWPEPRHPREPRRSPSRQWQHPDGWSTFRFTYKANQGGERGAQPLAGCAIPPKAWGDSHNWQTRRRRLQPCGMNLRNHTQSPWSWRGTVASRTPSSMMRFWRNGGKLSWTTWWKWKRNVIRKNWEFHSPLQARFWEQRTWSEEAADGRVPAELPAAWGSAWYGHRDPPQRSFPFSFGPSFPI